MVIDPAVLDAHRTWLAQGGRGEAGRLVASGIDARGQDLSTQDLSRCLITGCEFDGASFEHSRWRLARVSATSFRGAVFNDASLADAVFVDCDFRDADFSALGGAGSTFHGRFDRCDLRGTVWIDRDVSNTVFVDCRFDLMAGTPRKTSGVHIVRPVLARDAGGPREVTASDILVLWQVGAAQPPLSGKDKGSLRQSLRGRWWKQHSLAMRGLRLPPVMAASPAGDAWSEPFLTVITAPDPEESAPIVLPSGSAAGVIARRATSGAAIYLDLRIGFALVLPSPVFLEPRPYIDVTADVAGCASLQIACARCGQDVRAADSVAALVGEVTGGVPESIDLAGPGVAAAAVGTMRNGDATRAVAAIAGVHRDSTGVVLLIFDYNSVELDAAAALTIWSAILHAASFGVTPVRVAHVVPASAWWEAGFPLRLRASRPELSRTAGTGDAARDLLVRTGLRAPMQRINDDVRGEVTHRLASAGLADGARLARTLETIHDLRGLAAALAGNGRNRADAR